MKKNSIRIISALLIVLALVVGISNVAFATDWVNPSSLKGTVPTNTTQITDVGNKIIGAMKVAGSVAAVVILMVLGFKYLTGSTEEKADYKKSMIPYLIGAICIFLAPYIAGAIYDFLA